MRTVPAYLFAKTYTAAIGRSVDIVGDIRRQPVFVMGNGKPASDVLRFVAKALHATLETKRDGFVIRRTPTDTKALEKLYVDTNREIIEREISRFGADLDAGKMWGSPRQQLEAAIRRQQGTVDQATHRFAPYVDAQMPAQEFTPAGRLLYSTLQSMDITSIVELRPGESRVFSNRPTPDERFVAIQTTELDRFLAGEKALFMGGDPRQIQRTIANGTHSFVEWDINDVATADLTITLLVVRRFDGFALNLSVFDGRGRRIALTGAHSSHYVYGSPTISQIHKLMTAPRVDWTRHSKSALDFIAALHLPTNDELPPSPKAPETPIAQRAKAPDDLAIDRGEPDSRLLDYVLEVHGKRETGTPFVAALPDSLWSVADICRSPTHFMQSGLIPLAQSPLGECELITDADGSVLRPRNPTLSDAEFADREIMAKAFRQFLLDQDIRIEEWLRFESEIGDQSGNPLLGRYLSEFRRRQILRIQPDFAASPEFYRLIGNVLHRFDRLADVPKNYELNTPADHDALVAFLRYPITLANVSPLSDQERVGTKLLPTGRESVTVNFVQESKPSLLAAPIGHPDGLPAIPLDAVAALYFMVPSVRDRNSFNARLHTAFDKPELRFATSSDEVLHVEFRFPKGAVRTLEFKNEPRPNPEGVRFADVPSNVWDELYRITMDMKAHATPLQPAPLSSPTPVPPP